MTTNNSRNPNRHDRVSSTRPVYSAPAPPPVLPAGPIRASDRPLVARYFESASKVPHLLLLLGLIPISISLLMDRTFKLPADYQQRLEKITGGVLGLSDTWANRLAFADHLSWLAGLGAIFIAAAIVWALAQAVRSPSQIELDRQLSLNLRSLGEIAQRKLGMSDAERRTTRSGGLEDMLVFWSPLPLDLDGLNNGQTSSAGRFQRGPDQLYRFARYNILVIIPGQKHVGIYKAIYDFTTDAFLSQHMGEYRYSDLIDIKADPERDQLVLHFQDGWRYDINLVSAEQAASIFIPGEAPLYPYEDALRRTRLVFA